MAETGNGYSFLSTSFTAAVGGRLASQRIRNNNAITPQTTRMIKRNSSKLSGARRTRIISGPSSLVFKIFIASSTDILIKKESSSRSNLPVISASELRAIKISAFVGNTLDPHVTRRDRTANAIKKDTAILYFPHVVLFISHYRRISLKTL